jgi:hypothetical protein
MLIDLYLLIIKEKDPGKRETEREERGVRRRARERRDTYFNCLLVSLGRILL